MATNPYTSLDTSGWVYSTKNRLDYMFADFLVANYSQCPIEKVEASLPWLIAKHQGKPTDLAADVQRVLKLYLETQFSNVQVSCTQTPHPDRDDWIVLTMGAQVTDEEGLVYSLNEIRTVGNSQTIAIAKLNNGTLPYME